MQDTIAWAGDPPPEPSARIWTPKNDTPQWVVFLGPWRGVWVHWMGKRSLPCLEGLCPAARHRKPLVWLGYVPCAVADRELETGRPKIEAAIMPIGPAVADKLRSHLGNYPGPAVRVSAKPKGKGVEVHQVEPVKPGQTWPDCPDVLATLYRVWQMRPPCKNGDGAVE